VTADSVRTAVGIYLRSAMLHRPTMSMPIVEVLSTVSCAARGQPTVGAPLGIGTDHRVGMMHLHDRTLHRGRGPPCASPALE